MIVCGDDTLAQRLATELREVYEEQVVLVAPPAIPSVPRPFSVAGGRLLHTGFLRGVRRFSLRPQRDEGRPEGRRRPGRGPDEIRLIEAPLLNEEVLQDAGAAHAAAMAIVGEDDETNIRAALAARRLNPGLRLVIRLYNRKLGDHLEALLDQAVPPGADGASTTVLSDADTAAPALAATAVPGTERVIRAGDLVLTAAEHPAPAPGEVAEPGLITLAVLSETANGRQGAGAGTNNGQVRPTLLPDEATAASAVGRTTVVLQSVSAAGPRSAEPKRASKGAPLGALLSRRVRWSFAGMLVVVLAIASGMWIFTGGGPLHAVYLTFLDLFLINDPALDRPFGEQLLQLLASVAGLLLLPIVFAAALEALGTFRTASSLRRPRPGVSGHVVLLGLGKVGSRVLSRLRELGIPVVCVEENPEARGVAVARGLRVPTVIGDATQEGVLEAAHVERAAAMLALTSNDTTNLEAVLYARSLAPALRVALRVYDDTFASAVYRTLRAAHPAALTRSRSVSTLAAPAFAIAMMGRQIVGAIAVERRVLLIAAVDVAGHPQLQGRTVGQVFVPGTRRVVALTHSETARAAVRAQGPVRPLDPNHVLVAGDRVVLAVTRHGLAELLGRQPLPPES